MMEITHIYLKMLTQQLSVSSVSIELFELCLKGKTFSSAEFKVIHWVRTHRMLGTRMTGRRSYKMWDHGFPNSVKM